MVKRPIPVRKRYRSKPVEGVKVNPFVKAIIIVATSQRRVVIVSVTCSFILSSDFDNGMIPDNPSRIPVTEISKPVMYEIA
jgi:hypothetical protein